MNEEIEELAKLICTSCRRDNETNINCICEHPPCSGARNIAKDIYEAGYRSKDKTQSIVKTENKAVLQEFAGKLKKRIAEPLYNGRRIDELLKKYGIGEEE